MKRYKMIIMVFITGFLLIGCQNKTQTEESENPKSIAGEGLDYTAKPQGCEVVSESSEFYSVTENQEYQLETDMNVQMPQYIVGMTSAPETRYFIKNRRLLYYFNKTQKTSRILCNKPDCIHNDETCNALLQFNDSVKGLQYYEGSLYTVTRGEIQKLIKISCDGTKREEVLTIANIKETNGKEFSSAISWIMHRGYIYYISALSSGMTDDTYYLNGSNCIKRRKLDGTGDEECLMSLECGMDMQLLYMKAKGSYVYFILPEVTEKGLEGNLYRFNTESGKIEYLKELGKITDYALVGDAILYKKMENPYQILKYDGKEHKIENLIETEKGEKCYTNFSADSEYIYNYYYGNEGDLSSVYKAYDYDGNYIGCISKDKEKNYIGMDDEFLYFSSEAANGDTQIYYAAKKDLLTGEAQLLLLG